MGSSEGIALAEERYINLETFKKDGTGVKTPIWCAGLDGKIVVLTDGTSYKVKRIRNNPKVKIAPCDARGAVRGAWVDAECRVMEDPARAKQAHAALQQKYGWQVWILDVGAKIAGRFKRRAYLEITV